MHGKTEKVRLLFMMPKQAFQDLFRLKGEEQMCL